MLEHLTITDERSGAAFASAATRAMIFELMKGDRSLSDLRDQLGMSLGLLHYHIGRLQSLGLVTISSIRARNGRPIKMYRAAASEFRIPGIASRRTPGAGLKEELNQALERADLRQPSNTVYFLDGEGMPRMRRLQQADGSAHQRWWRLRLRPGDAAKLSREISDVVAKYENADRPRGEAHLCHFALVRA